MAQIKTVLISANTSWNLYHFRADLIHTLRAEGCRVISAAPEDVYTPRLKAMVDHHIALPMQNAGTSLIEDTALFFRYLTLLNTVKPHVMITYTIKPNIYGSFAAKLLGIPTIANVSGLGTAFIRNNWLTHVVKLLYRLAKHTTAHTFFQNSDDRDLFINMGLVKPEKTELVSGSGVDLTYFTPMNPPHDGAAPTSYLLIARLLWDKGIGEYVEAAGIVKARYPNSIFRLVGPKDVDNKTAISESTITQWVAQGNIDYIGASEDIRSIIAAHDVVVLPSYREGMSRVLLEAAAMGKPLITTDVPGCRQAVDQGKNGLLCNVRDAQDLAKAMIQFMQMTPEARTKMGDESRAKAEREFDQKHVIDAYLRKVGELTAAH